MMPDVEEKRENIDEFADMFMTPMGGQEDVKKVDVDDEAGLSKKEKAAKRRAEKQQKGKTGKKKGSRARVEKEEELEVEDVGSEDSEAEAEPEPEDDDGDMTVERGEVKFIPQADEKVNQTPNQIIICGVCNGPAEFCAYFDRWPMCEVWITENYPSILPKSVDVKHQKKKKISTCQLTKEIRVRRAKKGAKVTTRIEGLESYGIQLTKACKAFRTKFAASCSVQKDPAGGQYVEVQGDVCHVVADYEESVLLELFPDADIDMDDVKEMDAVKVKRGGPGNARGRGAQSKAMKFSAA